MVTGEEAVCHNGGAFFDKLQQQGCSGWSPGCCTGPASAHALQTPSGRIGHRVQRVQRVQMFIPVVPQGRWPVGDPLPPCLAGWLALVVGWLALRWLSLKAGFGPLSPG